MMILVCYDANLLIEIEKEVKIIKVKLQHWTSRQEHVVIQVCMLGKRTSGSTTTTGFSCR